LLLQATTRNFDAGQQLATTALLNKKAGFAWLFYCAGLIVLPFCNFFGGSQCCCLF